MFRDFQIKFVKNEVYLGDVISSQGLDIIGVLTKEKRMSKIKGVMHEAKSIMEDLRMQVIGGMAGARYLWETAILPSLLANCSSWVGIEKNIYTTLNDLQYTYLWTIYSCPLSTLLLALRTQANFSILVLKNEGCILKIVLFHISPACLCMRAFKSCHGGCQLW